MWKWIHMKSIKWIQLTNCTKKSSRPLLYTLLCKKSLVDPVIILYVNNEFPVKYNVYYGYGYCNRKDKLGCNALYDFSMECFAIICLWNVSNETRLVSLLSKCPWSFVIQTCILLPNSHLSIYRDLSKTEILIIRHVISCRFSMEPIWCIWYEQHGKPIVLH